MSAVHKTDYHRLAAAKRAAAIDLPDFPEEQTKPVEEIVDEKAHLTAEVRRIGYNDIPEIGQWLLPRLNRIWPKVSDGVWASKFRSWIMMNEASFVRTEHVVGLALSIQDDMDSQTRVYERFLLGSERSERLEKDRLHPIDAELLSIYRVWRDWARLKNAVRLQVLEHSDLRHDLFAKFYSWNLVRSQTTYVRFV